ARRAGAARRAQPEPDRARFPPLARALARGLRAPRARGARAPRAARDGGLAARDRARRLVLRPEPHDTRARRPARLYPRTPAPRAARRTGGLSAEQKCRAAAFLLGLD